MKFEGIASDIPTRPIVQPVLEQDHQDDEVVNIKPDTDYYQRRTHCASLEFLSNGNFITIKDHCEQFSWNDNLLYIYVKRQAQLS